MAYCTREEHAGRSPFKSETGTFAHFLQGPCPCGVEHAPAPSPGRAPRGKVESTHVYHDDRGGNLFRVVKRRLPDGGKTFYQQAWKPDLHTFRGGLKGVPTVLYHLPRLIAADPSQPVFVVEGEKDVERLESLGFVATCNPMGAEKWRDHYSDALRGRRCVVVVDNDDPGRRHVAKVARSLWGKAASIKVLELPGLAEHGDVSDWLAAGGTVERLCELAEAAPEWEPSGEASNAADGPPIVVISPREDEVCREVIKALAERDPDLYKMGYRLATIVDDGDAPRGVDYRDAPPPPQIQTIEAITVRGRITACTTIVKIKKSRDGEEVPVHSHPPEWLAPMIHRRLAYPGVRPLKAVIEAPTMRPDGTILETPGYDAATHLFYKPNANFEPVPAAPTRKDALAACEYILDVVCDFPFKTEADRAVWLAGFLEPFARPAVAGPCPMIVVDANTAGAGKTLLTDVIAFASTGRPMPRTVWPSGQNSDEELRKRITSIALKGSRMTMIDNIDEPLGGASLDAALTATAWEDRKLGSMEMTPVLPLHTIWYASGNNVQLRSDVLRRVLFSRIESFENHPEERQGFKHADLLNYVLKIRGKLAAAALTILRAYRLSGEDVDVPLLGSFEDWTRVVAKPVVWITGVNLFEVRDRTRANDTVASTRASLVAGWAELPNSERGLTVPEALQLVKDNDHVFECLRGAMFELSNTSDLPSPKSVGKYLAAMEGKTIDGKLLRSVTNGKKPKLWRIESVGGLGFTGSPGGLNPQQTPDVKSYGDNTLRSAGGLRGLNTSTYALATNSGSDDECVIYPYGAENKPRKPQTPGREELVL